MWSFPEIELKAISLYLPFDGNHIESLLHPFVFFRNELQFFSDALKIIFKVEDMLSSDFLDYCGFLLCL